MPQHINSSNYFNIPPIKSHCTQGTIKHKWEATLLCFLLLVEQDKSRKMLWAFYMNIVSMYEGMFRRDK